MNDTVLRSARFALYFNTLVLCPSGWICGFFPADAYPRLALFHKNAWYLSYQALLILIASYLLLIAERAISHFPYSNRESR